MDPVIERNPTLPDPFVVYEPQPSFLHLYDQHKLNITREYEQNKILVFQDFPLKTDRAFFSHLELDESFYKAGSTHGLDRDLFIRRGSQIVVNEDHLLAPLVKQNSQLAFYFYHSLCDIFYQLRLAVRTLFPSYTSLKEGHLAIRYKAMDLVPMHFDHYDQQNRFVKLKFVINVDSEYRVWRVSDHIFDAIKKYGEVLDTTPKTLNDVATRFEETQVLHTAPYHTLKIPPYTALFFNGETISHEVRYGNRMMSGEFFYLQSDLLDPEGYTPDILKTFNISRGPLTYAT